jgi:hypothetical protein
MIGFSGRLVLTGLLVSLFGAGCSYKSIEVDASARSQTREQAKLRAALEQFSAFVETRVDAAAQELKTRVETDALRERILILQTRMEERLHAALRNPDTLKALLDIWALCVRAVDYFVKGSGKDLFGEDQKIALDAAQQILTNIEYIAKQFLAAEDFERVKGQIRAHANSNALLADLSDEKSALPFTLAEQGANLLQTGLNLTLSPLYAITDIGAGVGAVEEFPPIANRFVATLEDYPRQLSTRLELLTLSLLKTETVGGVVESLKRYADSFAVYGEVGGRFATVAEELPEKVEETLKVTFEEFSQAQPELRETLREGQKLAGTFESISHSAGEMTEDVEGIILQAQELTARLTSLAQEVRGVIRDAQGEPDPPGVEPEEGEPFDINEYRQAADSIAVAADELRAGIIELRGMLESPALGTGADALGKEASDLLKETDAATRGLVDHIAWRVGQLLAVFFALLLGYRFLATRMRRSAAQ